MIAQHGHKSVRIRRVELSLSQLHAERSQTDIADAAGFASHAQISRRITRVSQGEVDGFLSAYSGLELLRLVFADDDLRATVHGLTETTQVSLTPGDDLLNTMAAAGKLIADAAAAMAPSSDGGRDLTRDERVLLDGELCALQRHIEVARRGLAIAAVGT